MERSLKTLLFVLYGCSFVAGFNENLMNMALVSIMGDFSIDAVTVQWLVTGYMVVVTVVVACMAYLYRRFSLRTLFFVAAGLNILGSLGGFCAQSFPMILVSRLIQALGTGIFIPLMMNVIVQYVPHERMGSYLALGSAMITIGPATAPIVTGFMVSNLGWRSIFLAPLIFGALFAVIGFFVVPKTQEGPQGRFDGFSAVLLGAAVTLLSCGLSQISSATLIAILELLCAVAALGLFARRQHRLEHPLISLKPLGSPSFWPAVLLVMITMMTYFSLSVVSPLYYEQAVDLEASSVGMLLIFPVLGNALTASVSGKVLDRKGEWPLLPAGFSVALGGVALACVGAYLVSPVIATVGIFLGYLGCGAVLSTSQSAGLRTLEPDAHSHGVALMNTSLQLAACLGPSLYVGVMSAVSTGLSSSGTPSQAASSEGFAVAMMISSLIVLVGLAIALRYARSMRRIGADQVQ